MAGIGLHAFVLASPSGWCDTADGVRALTPAQAEQERLRNMLQSAPKAYVDKVMVPDLPGGQGVDAREDDSGDFRSWFSETRLVTSSGDSSGVRLRSSNELGQSVGYRRETLNYGDYELLADVRASSGIGLNSPASGRSHSARVSVRNMGFPLTTRLFADTAVGDIFSEVTTALTRQYRLSLGSRPVRGLSTRVYSGDLDVRAGTGMRGNLVGGPFAGFESSGGTFTWLGASKLTPVGTVGIQFNRASGSTHSAAGAPSNETVHSAAAAYGWSGEPAPGLGATARFTAVHSNSEGGPTGRERTAATGWFAEGSLASDNAKQEFGVYSSQPNLRFGDGGILDARGAYWRIDRLRSSLGWGLGLQFDQQPAAGASPGSHRAGMHANVQWQVDRRNMVGGTLSVEQRSLRAPADGAGEGSRARSVYATAFYQLQVPRIGSSRFVVTARRNQVLVVNGAVATGEELQWEQDWLLGATESDRTNLSTSVGVARDVENGVARLSPTAGLRVSWSPAPRWNVSANLRYTSTRSNLSSTQGLSGFVDTEYSLDNGWRLGGSLNLNQGAVRVEDSLLVAAGGSQLFRTRDTTLSIRARWDGGGGSTDRGLGPDGTRSVGGGSLVGRVFLDENRDGRQQSQEPGVSGVEVILDGRFRTTTDSFGRYAFPLVSSGFHRVEVRQESVPLPWGAADRRGWRVEVPLRGELDLALPMVKVGD